MRRLYRFLPILTLLSLPVAGAAQDGDRTPEPALVNLQVGRYAARTVEAYRVGNIALVPVTQLFDLAEIGFTQTPAGGLEATLYPSGRRIAIDPLNAVLMVGERRVPLSADNMVKGEREFYLSTELLGEALGVEFVTLWSDLQVAIVDADDLPVGRRVVRDMMRLAMMDGSGSERADKFFTLNRQGIDGMVFDYSILTPSNDIVGGGTYSAALGVDLLGGSLELGIATEGPARDGRMRSDVSWTGVYRNDPYLRQIQLGDGATTGPRPRTVRGISVTNAPYQRSAEWGLFTWNGKLGPGWQVEAYRGGRLIAFDSVNALGGFSLDVPVQYGENPVDFVAYGPFGQVREFNRTYRVVSEVLPVGQFEYGVAGGACRATACEGTGNADLRYGLSNHWTVSAGIDAFLRDTLPNLWHPYASVVGTFGNAWAVEVEGVANAVLRTGVRYEPSLNLQVSSEFTDFAAGTVRPLLTPAGRRSQWTVQSMLRPLGPESMISIDAGVDRIWSSSSTTTSARLGGSLYAAQIRFLPNIRIQRTELDAGAGITSTHYGLNAFMLPRSGLGPFLGKVSARTTLDFSDLMSPEAAGLWLSRPVTSDVRIETGLSWSRFGQRMQFSLVVSTNLPSMRGYTTITAGNGAPVSASQYLQGSLLYNQATHGVETTPGPSLERSGLTGHVFLDSDGDGVRDQGEQGLPGVRVKAGITAGTTDSTGRYQIWDLLPFEPVIVSIDSLSLGSPLWVPTFATISVEPPPNRFRLLDIPVAPGGVIEGQVVRESLGGTRGVGGVTLLLRNVSDGETRSLLTFSDGEFYAIGVKPGEYVISVDGVVLERLEVRAAPVRFVMPADPEGATVDGMVMRLE